MLKSDVPSRPHLWGRSRLVAASGGTPEGPWLKTGDSGFISDGELFIVGRIKEASGA